MLCGCSLKVEKGDVNGTAEIFDFHVCLLWFWGRERMGRRRTRPNEVWRTGKTIVCLSAMLGSF